MFTVSRDLSHVGRQKRPHVWNPDPYLPIYKMNFYGALMRNKGCLLLRPLMLKAEISKSENGPIFRGFYGSGGQGLKNL